MCLSGNWTLARVRWSCSSDSPRAELRCTPIRFGALDERNLPTEPDDVNGIAEAPAAMV